jgi:prepilin-type N-terminal cleavage/methylation domain-containing protein
MKMKTLAARSQLGFSLIELMVVLLLLSVLMGAVFRQINQVQARAKTEQSRTDIFQQAREFVDQMSRDLRQAGYPNLRNFTSGTLITPEMNDTNNAVGLVRVAVDEIRFEGNIDDDQTVESIRYTLATTGTNCPCLQRSEVDKLAANPLTGQGSSLQTEVQDVLNGTTGDPIFRAFDSAGSEITLPVDINSNPNTMASIKTIQMSLTVRAQSPDLETRLRPQTTVRTTIGLNNCSGAATGQAMSCTP